MNLRQAGPTLELELPLQRLGRQQLGTIFQLPFDLGAEIYKHLDAPAAKAMSRVYLAAASPEHRRMKAASGSLAGASGASHRAKLRAIQRAPWSA